jgi:hypothetical protein
VETIIAEPPAKMIRANLIGVLLGSIYGGGGVDVVLMVRITEPGGEDYIVPCAERVGTGKHVPMWTTPDLLFPWIVNSLLSFIHEHRTTVVETTPSYGMRKDFGRLAKKTDGLTLIPRPYYVVPLKDTVIRDRAARKAVYGVARRTPLNYRHDRRGHERCRIQRGLLPMDAKTRAKLEKRGYKLFTVTDPDGETQRRLIERRQPRKRAYEWIAVKVTWIDQCVVGPEDAPYVPAVRVSDKGV